MTKTTPPSPKWHLLQWLIVPLVLIWLATNYVLGITRRPQWDTINRPAQGQILAAHRESQIAGSVDGYYSWNNTGLVTLWFDDGWTSQYTVAGPILKKYGFNGTIAITTGLVGYEAYVTWPQIKRLQFDGWELTAHSRDHNCNPENLTPEELEAEIIGSLQDFRNQGLKVDHYVAPCGIYDHGVMEMVKREFLSLRNSDYEVNPLPVVDPYDIKGHAITPTTTLDEISEWIDEAVSTQGWLILMFHQVDASQDDYSIDPETFERILDLVVASDLPVVTPSQALQVAMQYDQK